jgi:hypothetical protein
MNEFATVTPIRAAAAEWEQIVYVLRTTVRGHTTAYLHAPPVQLSAPQCHAVTPS